MAQQASVVQESLDQVRTAVRRADRQLKKVQRRVTTRRKQVEKELTSRRKSFERRVQRELRRFQRELRRQPLVKRAEALQKETAERIERRFSGLLEAFPLATKGDVARIDRKLTALNRKLRELERVQPA